MFPSSPAVLPAAQSVLGLLCWLLPFYLVTRRCYFSGLDPGSPLLVAPSLRDCTLAHKPIALGDTLMYTSSPRDFSNCRPASSRPPSSWVFQGISNSAHPMLSHDCLPGPEPVWGPSPQGRAVRQDENLTVSLGDPFPFLLISTFPQVLLISPPNVTQLIGLCTPHLHPFRPHAE